MRRAAVLSVFVLCLPALASRARTEPAPDRLAAEIDRWGAFLRTNAATDETWKQLKEGAEPLMARARSALADGRRLLALQRLLAAPGRPRGCRLHAGAAGGAGPGRGGLRGRVGAHGGRAARRLRPAPAATPWPASGPRPCARGRRGRPAAGAGASTTRASSTAGTPCRSTASTTSGAARAAAEAVELCLSLSRPGEYGAAARALTRGEIEALEERAARCVPAAGCRSTGTRTSSPPSSMVKEARELDAAGLRPRRVPALPPGGPALRAAPARRRHARRGSSRRAAARASTQRLSAAEVDHSLGRLFLERAQEALADVASGTRATAARDRRRRAAPLLRGPRARDAPRRRRPQPRVTVTLVRWPYT